MLEDRLHNKNDLSAEITVKDWMKLDCITFLSIIPIIGSIAALVIYIVLAFHKDTAKSISSRLKANLIWLSLSLIISLFIIIIILLLFINNPVSGLAS